MNDITPAAAVPHSATTTPPPQATACHDDEAALERQMTALGLSPDACRFLRHLHIAEKQLNQAFGTAHQGGALEERISRVYRELYGVG